MQTLGCLKNDTTVDEDVVRELILVALIVGDSQELVHHRDIVVDHRSFGLQRISDLHPAFMAMQYPFLFPYGEDGLHIDIQYVCSQHRRKTKKSSITAGESYAYVIKQCPSNGSTLIKGGKLFHQYVVDAFTSIEGMRLEYIKRKQKKWCCDIFQGIVDALSKGDRCKCYRKTNHFAINFHNWVTVSHAKLSRCYGDL
ncbi:hypothetical protein PTKIN_Ptkin11bG0177900 [Pterospermum kingtungense]